MQLLRDYRAFHTAFGGARPFDETNVVDAAYGPAGYIGAGQAFDKADRRLLAESFAHLEHALTLLQKEHMAAYLVLLSPYLSDPADPSLVEAWRERERKWERERERLRQTKAKTDAERAERQRRLAEHEKKKPRLAEWHDLAVDKLAGYLERVDLYVAWPARMSSQQETQIERRNDELYALYRKLREEKMGKTKAVETAAEMCGYSERRAWEIVRSRESARAS